MNKIILSDTSAEFLNLVDGFVFKKNDKIIPVRQINNTFYIEDPNGEKNAFIVISIGELLNMLIQNLNFDEKGENSIQKDI